jgi:D-3-phosphoglycerate dehydrogenase / 2-oxoglutarate reductase
MHLLAVDTLDDSIFELLRALPTITFHYEPTLTRAEILARIGAYQGLIIRSKTTIDASFLAYAPNLKIIARAGSGLDLIDLEETTKRGIICINAPEGNRDAVAEHTVGLLLALLHMTAVAHTQVRAGKWLREANRGFELKHKTVGIIGCGNVGTEVAHRLLSFGCKILAYDIRHTHPLKGVHHVTMDEIFAQADILTLHVPLTTETKHLVTHDYLQRFAKPIWIINTSRGEIIDLQALCEAIEAGKVRGAGLDVLENEKITQLTPSQQQAFDYLAASPHTILTPHIAGWTFESYRRINEVLVEKIAQFI